MKKGSRIAQINDLVNRKDIKAIGFDVFACMLKTQFADFTDIYDVVQHRLGLGKLFRQQRVLAEKEARAHLSFQREKITYDQIYDQMQRLFSYDDADIARMKDVELSVIYDYCQPRQSIKTQYDIAMKNGKDVFVIADTYYPTNFIRRILADNGYGKIALIFTTADTALSERSGRFHQRIQKDVQTQYGNQYALVVNGQERLQYISSFGKRIKQVYIGRTIDLYRKRSASKVNEIRAPWPNRNAVLFGYMASRLSDGVEQDEEILCLNKDDERLKLALTYDTGGPVILSVCINILTDAAKNGVNKLVFIGKESAYFKRLLETVQHYCRFDMDIQLMDDALGVDIHPLNYRPADFVDHLVDPLITFKATVGDFITQKMFIVDEHERSKVLEIFRKAGYRNEQSRIGNFREYSSTIPALQDIYVKEAQSQNEALRAQVSNMFSASDRVGVVSILEPFELGGDILADIGAFRKSYAVIPNGRDHESVRVSNDCFVALDTIDTNDEGIRTITHMVEQFLRGSYQPQAIAQLLADQKQKKKTDETQHLYSNDGELLLEAVYDQLVDMQGRTEQLIREFCTCYEKELPALHFDVANLLKRMKNYIVYALEMEDEVVTKMMDYFVTFAQISEEELDSAHIVEKEYSELYKRLYVIGYKLGIVPLLKRMFHIGTQIGVKRITPQTFEEAYLDAIQQLDAFTKTRNKPNVVFAGMMLSSTKGTIQYINALWERTTQKNIVLLSEYNNKKLTQHSIERKVYADYFVLPELLAKNSYVAGVKIKTTNEIEETLSSKQYLLNAVANIKDMNRLVHTGYIKTQVYYVYRLFNHFLDKTQPEKVILWNQFHAFNSILQSLCDERKIDTMYFEFGVIPGTYVIERQGQMGESYPATNYEEFLQLEYSKPELREAQKVIDFLRATKQNRNVYDERSDIAQLMSRLAPGRPIVMYAGQYDYEAGLFPYTLHSKQYHSPNFESSVETAVHLYRICKKNGWNFIYKPHPLMARIMSNINRYPSGMMVVTDVDIHDVIRISDVAVTLFSQTAYLSLIAEKATMMLGYNQLKHKGCVYEAYQKLEIEDVLAKAIREGYTDDMKHCFEVHVTQLLRHYLYSDGLEREIRYGRCTKDMVAVIEDDA